MFSQENWENAPWEEVEFKTYHANEDDEEYKKMVDDWVGEAMEERKNQYVAVRVRGDDTLDAAAALGVEYLGSSGSSDEEQ